MNILMVDQNSIVDRRITLEAESLTAAGHHVEIVAVEARDELNIQNNILIKRFEYLNSAAIISELPKGVVQAVNTDNLIRLKDKMTKLGLPNRISIMASAFVYPKEGLLLLSSTRSLTETSKVVLKNIYLFQLGNYKIDFKGLIKTFKYKKKENGLNFWEQQVLDYAVSKNFNVVHAHDLPSMNVAVEIKKKLNCKLVYDAHELYSYQPGIPKDKARAMFSLEKQQIQNFDQCIVINDEQAEVMRKDFNFNHFTALTNATSITANFDENKKYDLIREKLNIVGDTLPILLFQGGINKLRKIDYLMRGVAQAKTKTRLALLTWGYEIEEFKLFAKELGISDRVHFLDPVPWQDILFWAASSDVGFMPYQPLDINTRLSCPNKMYEFINACTPMIGSSELINVKKVVGGEGFGLVTPLREAIDYANAIDTFFTMDRAEMKRQLVLKRHKYTWNEEAKKLISLYEKLN